MQFFGMSTATFGSNTALIHSETSQLEVLLRCGARALMAAATSAAVPPPPPHALADGRRHDQDVEAAIRLEVEATAQHLRMHVESIARLESLLLELRYELDFSKMDMY